MEWSTDFPGINLLVANANKCAVTTKKDGDNTEFYLNNARVATFKPFRHRRPGVRASDSG